MKRRKTCQDSAFSIGDVALDYVLREGAKAGAERLLEACKTGDSQCVELLLKHGVNADAQRQDGATALMSACMNGHSQCVELLLKHGVNADAQEQNGWTALMYSCHYGHSQSVELLLKHGADVTAQQALGRNALYFACRKCDVKSIHLLLDAKADVHQCERSAVDNVFGINLFPIDDPNVCKASREERRLAAFLLMCHGYDLKKCSGSHVAGVLRDYQRIHSLLEERYRAADGSVDQGSEDRQTHWSQRQWHLSRAFGASDGVQWDASHASSAEQICGHDCWACIADGMPGSHQDGFR